MPLFDTIVIVDWSARSEPSPKRPSSNAIWWAVARKGEVNRTEYARTRHKAIEDVAGLIASEVAKGRRVMAGFDFPFGYPRGVAKQITGSRSSLELWQWLSEKIKDDTKNANNRYAVASKMAKKFPGGVGPFWGRPKVWNYPDIPARRKDRTLRKSPAEKRIADDRASGAKSVWQLFFAGSVGSQVLLGLPALNRLRKDERLAGSVAVWPFEGGLRVPDAPVVLVEVYPSLIKDNVAACGDVILDRAQVRVNARAFSALDVQDCLEPLFCGPQELTAAQRKDIEKEEGWILGLGFNKKVSDAVGMYNREDFSGSDLMVVDWLRVWDSEGAEGIERLLSAVADPGARDRNGRTCLFPVAAAGDERLLKTIIAAQADVNVNAHDHAGETPILVAAREGRVSMVRMLLELRAKAVVRNDEGTTPLHLAAGHGDSQLVRLLLGEPTTNPKKPYWSLNGQSVDLDARDGEGRTPLHFVAKCENELSQVGDLTGKPHPELVVDQLIGAGAEPNAQDNHGATPLHIAAESRSTGVICALLRSGACPIIVDLEGMTPLHHLVMIPPELDPDLRAFMALTEAGADPNAPDNRGRTPLHHVSGSDHAAEGEAAFVKALLEAGAKANLKDRSGRTPLHCALKYEGSEFGPVVRTLLDGGADPNAKDDGLGQTALHMAVDAEQVKLLIKAGARLYAQDADWRTPLLVAVQSDAAEVARALVAAGADPYHRPVSSDWSPIDEANERKAGRSMVRALIGNPNKRDENGRTPLHEAAVGGLENWTKALLDAGANPNVRDRDGRTPLHEAHEALAGGKACVEVLTAAGADPTIKDKDGDTRFRKRRPISRRQRTW